MTIESYITFNDVRAALGVSQEEIKDPTLSLDVYTLNLVSELEDIALALPADYDTAVAAPTPTALQTRFVSAVKLFATYAVAKQATIALPMFSPKEQTDGKAGLTRFALDPYKATIARVLEQYELFKAKLIAAYAALNDTGSPTVLGRPYFVVASPDSDPVLGT